MSTPREVRWERMFPDETFERVEEIWSAVVRPALPEFHTMQDTWDTSAVPEESSWRRNRQIPRMDHPAMDDEL